MRRVAAEALRTGYIPPVVFGELQHSGTPAAVKTWVVRLPNWIEVHTLKKPLDTTLGFLDQGERQAIQLAQEQRADVLLIDDRKGRIEASRRGLIVTGTLGILLAAGELGLIDPNAALQRLVTETTFRSTSRLYAQIFGGK